MAQYSRPPRCGSRADWQRQPHQLADRNDSLHPVCRVWREQLYRSDTDHERRCGTGEHHAGVDVRKIQKKGGQQSYLRRDRHSTVSGADGAVYAAVCNRCIDPVELISENKKRNKNID